MLKSLAARIVFAPKDFADAREISDELGFTTVKVKTLSTPLMSFDSGGRRSRSQSVSEQRRALLLPQEVKELGTEEALIFYEGLRPIRCRKIRYFADRRFRERLLEPPSRPAPGDRVPEAPVSATTVPADPEVSENAMTGRVREILSPNAIAVQFSDGTREATVEDIERIESLTAEDFAVDPSRVKFPDHDGPLSVSELEAVAQKFVDSLNAREV